MEQSLPQSRPLAAEDHRRLAKALGLYVLKDRLNPEELASRLPSLVLLSFSEGTEIVREGEVGCDLYIVSHGSAGTSSSGGRRKASPAPPSRTSPRHASGSTPCTSGSARPAPSSSA